MLVNLNTAPNSVSKGIRFVRNLAFLLGICLLACFLLNLFYKLSRDSVDGITTRYGLGESGDRIPVGERFSAPVQTGPGPIKTSVHWVPSVSRG